MYLDKKEARKLANAWQGVYNAYNALEDLRPGGGFKSCKPPNLSPLIKRMEYEVKLLKKTVVMFAEALQEQGKGHTPDWQKCLTMLDKCEDEMDIDNNN